MSASLSVAMSDWTTSNADTGGQAGGGLGTTFFGG